MTAPSHCAICKVDCTDCEHALTAEQGRALGRDAETAIVCLDCSRNAEVETTARALDAAGLHTTARTVRRVTEAQRARTLRAARSLLDYASGRRVAL